MHNRVVCFWGDSLAVQFADSLRYEALGRPGDALGSNRTRFQARFGPNFNILSHTAPFLFHVEYRGNKLAPFTSSWTLDLRHFDAPTWLGQCDVLVMNTYTWWGGLGAVNVAGATYRSSISNVIYPEHVHREALHETLPAAWSLLFEALHAATSQAAVSTAKRAPQLSQGNSTSHPTVSATSGRPTLNLKRNASVFFHTWPGSTVPWWQARLASVAATHSVRLLNTTMLSAYGHGAASHRCSVVGPRFSARFNQTMCDVFHFCNRNSVPMIWNLVLARELMQTS